MILSSARSDLLLGNNLRVVRVIKLIKRKPAMMNMAWVKLKTPIIIGPTNPPNEERVLTNAMPAGAVDSEKKKVI